MKTFYILGLVLGALLGVVFTIGMSTHSDGLRLIMLLLGAGGLGFVTNIYDAMDDGDN